MRYAMQRRIGRDVLEAGINASFHVDVIARDFARDVVMEFSARMPGKKEKRETSREKERRTFAWPRDWWQAFRQRWMPAWWLKRWPVQMHVEEVVVSENVTEIHETRVCPHVRVPEDRRHLCFVAGIPEPDYRVYGS
jgi:hypothetical protein